MGKKWFSINAKAKTPEITIYDEIGIWGVTAKDFHDELKALGDLNGKPLTLRLSSPGGDVFTGNAIYNMLRSTGADVTVWVDGVAASMGSLIAMVGKTINMAENALMMIHNPAGFAGGSSDDLRRHATLLDTLRAGLVTAYATRSGQSEEAVSRMMDEETWFTAQQAVSLGFASAITAPVSGVAQADLSKYRHPPAPVFNAAPKVTAKAEESEMTNDEMQKAISEAVAKAIPSVVDAVAAKMKPADAGTEGDKPETPAAMEARIKAEQKAYRDEVRELCTLARCADKAEAFINAETPIAEVRAKLAEASASDKGGDKRKVHGSTTAPNNHQRTTNDGQSTDDDDTSDLVVNNIDSRSVWGKRNAIGGAIARMRIKDKAA